MNLVILRSSEVDEAGQCILSDERARHIHKVLKVSPGRSLRVGLLNGPLGTAVVQDCGSDSVELACTFERERPPEPNIDLLLAMPRPKVMKRLWAQLSALGVGRIVLLRAEKVERFYFDSHVVDPGFYTPLLIEGLQQARCTHLPRVDVRPLFKPFIEDELDVFFGDHLKLVADPSGEKRLQECLVDGAKHRRFVVAIGPEGGWTPYEIAMLENRGFQRFAMGMRVLRTDTATVGLLAILGELQGNG